jgi:hypothetical protein
MAVNCWVPLTLTEADVGVTTRLVGVGFRTVSVEVAVQLTVQVPLKVAVIVTVPAPTPVASPALLPPPGGGPPSRLAAFEIEATVPSDVVQLTALVMLFVVPSL